MDIDTEEQAEAGFLSRWSRRKRQADEEQAQEPTAPVAADPDPAPPALTDADMPAIDSLDEQSDYSGFLSPGVSDELRQLALRKLFRSAGFNVRDGLDDYDDDFTSFAKLGDIVTREMRVRQAIDDAREKAKAALAEAESNPPESLDAIDEPEPDADTDAAQGHTARTVHAQQPCVEDPPDEQPNQPA